MHSQASSLIATPPLPGQWTREEAEAWQIKQGFRTGCNFYPSTAINQIEMWQASTWDPDTIQRELDLAASIGMSLVRVYLHDMVWESDPDGFLSRMDDFLCFASSRGIETMFVLFDDCWNGEGDLGPQPAPKPSVHNSGWLRSPLDRHRSFPEGFSRLEAYVKAVLLRFKDDERLYLWDLYNEPGNGSQEIPSLPLLQKVFEWAREIRPSQPISVGIWFDKEEYNSLQAAQSDVITFHHYSDLQSLKEMVEKLKPVGRPLVCTEWMARTSQSLVQTHLPWFAEQGITAINWGLVKGKTQTCWPWGTEEGAPEADPWFHDLFWPDGRVYSEEEAEVFRSVGRH